MARPACVRDAGVRAAALDHEVAELPSRLDRLPGRSRRRRSRARWRETRAPIRLADAAVAADDVVVLELVHSSRRPSPHERIAQGAADRELDEQREDVEEDCHTPDDEREREHLRGRVVGGVDETRRVDRVDRAEERLERVLVEQQRVADRADDEQDDEGADGDPHLAGSDRALHGLTDRRTAASRPGCARSRPPPSRCGRAAEDACRA